MHHTVTGIAAAVLLTAGCTSMPVRTPVLLPWGEERASRRQVFEVRTRTPRNGLVVKLPLAGPCETVRVCDGATPGVVLPAYRSGDTLWVRLPRRTHGLRRVTVYSGPELTPSPTLSDKPAPGDDYATAAHGDAWDFDEDDQDGIRSWGDRPHHYGEVTVKDGTLNVPVTGKDPYCIWGVMFGNPAHQPPGHADSPEEAIDSSRYTRLALRVRQDCSEAKWTVYFTDRKGRYQAHDFKVKGTDFQVLTFDLPEIYPGFWDGRVMRSFRLDMTNDRPGTNVQVDWVRILPPPPMVTAGPVCTRQEVLARARTRAFRLDAPDDVTAGHKPSFRITDIRPRDRGLPPEPTFVCELRTAGLSFGLRPAAFCRAGGIKNVPGTLQPDVGGKVRELVWVVGVRDDMGRAMPPLRTGTLCVRPAELDHYVLAPQRRFEPIDGTRETGVVVSGADAFGNTVPVRCTTPDVDVTEGGSVLRVRRDGRGRVITLKCSAEPLTRHRVTFSDENGITGACEVRTVGFRRGRVRVGPAGYLTVDGEPFLPLGGFYANWPSGLPDAEGRVTRAVDLFPCGPHAYPHGFPWPEDVERKVVDYLDLCRRNGVTALRLMLRNMDIVGRVDPVQLKATLHLFELGRQRGLRFNVALFEDYTKPPYVSRDILEKIALPHYTPEQLAALPPHRARFLVEKRVLENAAQRYLNRDAIRCQKAYLDELIPVLAREEAVFCYEFENEMVRPPMSWCRDIAAYIRSIDPRTPVLGNPGPHRWPEPWRWRDSSVDLFSYHPYNDGLQEADHGAVIFIRSKWAAAAGIPFYTGEGGINQNRWQKDVKKAPQAFAMRGARDQIWLSMMCGANGAFLWTAGFESEMAQFGNVRPALAALGVKLVDFVRRRPRTVLVMPDDASANAQAAKLAWCLLGRGVDFDTRLVAESAEYAVRIDASAQALPDDLLAEYVEPLPGWQAATLVAQDARQALVYLRNVKGGIHNLGGKRACWLRTPQPAVPGVRLRGGHWHSVKALDLDTMEVTPCTLEDGLVALPAESDHDYLLYLQLVEDHD